MKHFLLFALTLGILSCSTDNGDEMLAVDKTQTESTKEIDYYRAWARHLLYGQTYAISAVKKTMPESEAEAVETILGNVKRISKEDFQKAVEGSLWYSTMSFGMIKDDRVTIDMLIGESFGGYFDFQEKEQVTHFGQNIGFAPYCNRVNYFYNAERNIFSLSNDISSYYNIITAIEKDTIDVIRVNNISFGNEPSQPRYYWSRLFRVPNSKKAELLKQYGCE